MSLTRFAVWIFVVGMLVLGTSIVSAQDFPNKPVRIVTAPAGGGSDFEARTIAQGITGPLGQPVIVDNRGGNLPAEIVSRAPPDGYTLLVEGNSFWTGPLLQKMPYDPVRDFSPVTLTSRSVSVLVVHPAVAANSIKELIALAKAKPGVLNYGSGSTGGAQHISGELFKTMAGVNIVRIPYSGTGAALTGLIAGEVHIMFVNVPVATAHLKAGRLRALAVTTGQPTALAPGLPTVSDSGLPGFESAGLTGVFAPDKTAEAIINRLNREIVRFLKTAEAREKIFNTGAEAIGSSPAEFAATVKSEISKLSKLIKDANIRIE